MLKFNALILCGFCQWLLINYVLYYSYNIFCQTLISPHHKKYSMSFNRVIVASDSAITVRYEVYTNCFFEQWYTFRWISHSGGAWSETSLSATSNESQIFYQLQVTAAFRSHCCAINVPRAVAVKLCMQCCTSIRHILYSVQKHPPCVTFSVCRLQWDQGRTLCSLVLSSLSLSLSLDTRFMELNWPFELGTDKKSNSKRKERKWRGKKKKKTG